MNHLRHEDTKENPHLFSNDPLKKNMNRTWAFFGLFLFTLKKLWATRKILWTGGVVILIPMLFALFVREDFLSFIQVMGIKQFLISVSILWSGILIGFSLLPAEFQEQTHAYPLSGALSRAGMVLPMVLAGITVGTLLGSLSGILPLVLAYQRHPLASSGLFSPHDLHAYFWAHVGAFILLSFYGSCLYVPLSNLIGLLLRKGLVWGYAALIFLEYVLPYLPLQIAKFTLTNTLVSFYNGIVNFFLTTFFHTATLEFKDTVTLGAFGFFSSPLDIPLLSFGHVLLYSAFLMVFFVGFAMVLHTYKSSDVKLPS